MKEKPPVPKLISDWDKVLADNDRVMERIYQKSGIERVVYQPKKGDEQK